ncbi:hypothetical protein GHNINEIG_01984 [Hydrogenovibrio crunogenus]|uniref:DUF4411 family protein n=1 Tax=Hydrogenovibrio crunogenus TaxID=39765 RepID=A0A4P7P227_9GAMM|nr:hypothetical protein [Hydrogenovibrio crunogenus]QBZ83915.1 hypothetical protein GHNINEIG_01984 [Hydrogenovibrio crunogenus]
MSDRKIEHLTDENGRIPIFLDNNVWDFLFRNRIDLCAEFPPKRFNLCINKEVSFEKDEIPNLDTQEFIKHLMDECVKVIPFFGFYDERHSPDKQRSGGFGDLFNPGVGGVFSDKNQEAYRKQLNDLYLKAGKNKKTDLYKNEADIDLAVRSMSSIVLTLDKKRGPLKTACDDGNYVVFLNHFEWFGGGSLESYVLEQFQ